MLFTLLLIGFLLFLLTCFLSPFLSLYKSENRGRRKSLPEPVSIDELFKMKTAIFHSTSLQRQNCSYGGQIVKVSDTLSRVEEIGASRVISYSSGERAFDVRVIVTQNGKSCPVGWQVLYKEDDSYDLTSYSKYNRCSSIGFIGKISQNQNRGEDRIWLEDVLVSRT
jgi:hypothetical protein